MDDTLGSSKSIGCRSLNSNMSFIYGRDPSILAYGQLPLPQEITKKGLDYLSEDEEPESSCSSSLVPSISTIRDTIKVFLRLKPFPRKMKLTQQQQEAYQIIDAHTLLTKLPRSDNNCSRLKSVKASDTICRKFTFTTTFGPETTQLQLFEQTVKQEMNEFLNGQSATVMSYGTTNAGKSYTLQGTTVSPGIIPRGLEFVFSNINPRATPCYKPFYNTDVVSLDARARAHEMELKTRLLSFGSIDKTQYIQAYRSMQQLLQDESPLKQNEASDANYSVWVSFAEIYNETIFDLLSNDCQKKRPSLKLATDNNGKAFIRDLKMVCVNSGSEAYQLLMLGQYNLKVAATALNTRSSRSHCIFTIKLLKYHKENSPKDVEVSTFSFCDLAGSERLKKTLNTGDRLKEAQNINTSLLVLGRCLKSIFDVQTAKLKHEVNGPFRESKLTRLFQSALSGKERIALIVNVNPVPNLYIETQNVLNFSAIAKHIVIEPVVRQRKAFNSRFSQMVSQSITTVTDWDVTDLESIGEVGSSSAEKTEYIHVEDYEEVVQENDKLKKELAKLKSSALNADFETRQELSNIYMEMIKNLESNFKHRLQDAEEQQADLLEWSVKQVEDYYKEKLSQISHRKRSRVDSCDETDDEVNVEELEAENVQLTTKVESLIKSVKELRESKKQLIIENNRNAFELSLTKKDLENCKNLLHAAQNDIDCGHEANQVIDELKKQLSAREDQIKSLKSYLNDAKEEWIGITGAKIELEESLEKKDEQLLELSEKITDLTEQLDQANVCLAESTKNIEILEDKLDLYARNLATAEDKWNKSAANNLVISKENEELKRRIDDEISRGKLAADKCTCQEKILELEELNKELSRVTDEAEVLKKKIAAKDENLDILNTKLLDSENENSLLKHKLSQSSDDAKLLREELDSTKSMLCDISEQINILKVDVSPKAATVDVDCQTNLVNDGETTGSESLITVKQENNDDEEESPITNNNGDNNQDAEAISNKKIQSTTSNGSKIEEETNEKLEQLAIEHNDLKTRFLYSNLRVDELCKELDDAKQELTSVKTSFDVNKQKLTVYQDLVKSTQNDLRVSDTELTKTEEELEAMKLQKEVLENRFSESEQIVEKLRSDLEESQNKNREHSEALVENLKKIALLEDQLSETLDKLQEISTKCSADHENQIIKLEKDISAATERDVIKEQLLDAHIQRISKLEKDLAEASDLREKVTALENELKLCNEEKASLQKQLDENCEKILSLENDLQASIMREQDKENETITLQKELKSIIQTNAHDSKRDVEMEKEVKKTLRELTETQKALAESEAMLKQQELRLKTYEENALDLALLQQGAERREAESEQLKILNGELRREIAQKTQELISFNKNRDITIQRYESLVKQLQEDMDRSKREVKQLQEEMDRSKREVSRYQELFLRQSTPTPHKEEIKKLKNELRSKTSLLEQVQDKLKKSESSKAEKENINTSEDDENLATDARRTRRRARNNTATSAAHDVSVIELSGSESKRVTRRTALPPPSTIPSVEKRKTRKKKLFSATDDTCMDVESTETVHTPNIRSPLSATRSLRNRRK